MGVKEVQIDVFDKRQISFQSEGRIKGGCSNLWGRVENRSELGEHPKGRIQRHPALRGLEPFAVVRGTGRKPNKCGGKEKRLNPDLGGTGLGVAEHQNTKATQGVGRVVVFTNIQPSFYPSPVIA